MPQSYRFRSPLKTLGVRIIDAIGSFFFRAGCISPDFSTLKKILVIRIDHLGDVAMTRPAIRMLKEAYPHLQISLLVSEEFAPLFQDDSWVDEIIPLHDHWFTRGVRWPVWIKTLFSTPSLLKTKQFDMAIDFRGDFRTIFMLWLAGIPRRTGFTGTGGGFLLTYPLDDQLNLHQVFHNTALLESIKISGNPQKTSFTLDPKVTQKLLAEYTAALNPHAVKIVVHPGAGLPSKKWAGEKWQELLTALSKNNKVRQILIGSESEKKDFTSPATDSILDLRGKTNLRELLHVISLCDYFIGGDSGPGHLAASQEIPGLILFSETNDPKIWKPWSEKLRILAGNMQKISTEEVLQIVSSEIDKLSVTK